MWSSEAQSAFDQLKRALTTAPVLSLPNFQKQFVIETDACDVGIGAVLMQQDHPIAFVSRALGPRNRGLSVYEKEYMAILLAVEHWRPYLQFQEFGNKTPKKSLTPLKKQRQHTQTHKKILNKNNKIVVRRI